MSESGEEARIKQLLVEIEQMSDIPDYPDFRRGMRWGAVCAIPALLLLLVILACGGSGFWARLLHYGWLMLGIAGVIFLVAWAFGAFRPAKY